MYSAIRAWLRPSSLRARLTFWYLLILGAALATLAVFVFIVQARALHRELDAELASRAHQFAGEHLQVLLGLDVASRLAEDPRAAAAPALVRQRSGSVVFRSEQFPKLDWGGEREATAAARDRTTLLTVSDRSGSPVRIATVIVRRPGAEDLAVQMAAPSVPVRDALRRLALGMALFILMALVVASYGGGFLARRALAPVDEIVRSVRDIQTTRLGTRLDVRPDSDELDRLVVTLNEMLDRIEASVRIARRFAADASHELQTPIATMRGAVELCLRAESSSVDQGLLADLLAEMDRLSALVRDLRLLALADTGQLVESTEAVDLAGLTSECCEIAQAMAEERGIRVETFVAERPTVRGSPLHLRRVILNLLQNAIRYSPASSRLVVSVGRANGQAMLAVLDHGCGIAPRDLPHIFEPFFRADPARARDTGGTGLGLAIVDQIVRLHGGQVKVASTPGRGSAFVIYLPSAPEDSLPSPPRPEA